MDRRSTLGHAVHAVYDNGVRRTAVSESRALKRQRATLEEKKSSLEAALRELETHCALCAAPPPDGGPPWNRCGRCGVPSYCSRECQRMAWKRCELVRRAG